MYKEPLHIHYIHGYKTKRHFFLEKKLGIPEPVHPSHGSCYGRGYTALLGRALVPQWTSNNKYNYK